MRALYRVFCSSSNVSRKERRLRITPGNRAGLPPERAAAEITGSAGSQLCPTVVAAFRSLFENGRFTLAASEGVLRAVYEPLGRV